MAQISDAFEDLPDFHLRTIDEIWEQWNQSNELSTGTNLPNSVRNRQQDTAATAITEVFDSEFKYLYKVPSYMVVHVPSVRLNITRLVLCRNYRPWEPDSCAMGVNCKFVHADVDLLTLEAHPIHVNYIWRHEDLCTYKRLKPGEMVEVLSTDNRSIETIPSERILVTRGALARHDMVEPLIRCKYYDASQTCYTGERCNFVHVIFVDPNVPGVFKRAPKAHTESRNAATAPLSSNTNGTGNMNCNGNASPNNTSDTNKMTVTSPSNLRMNGNGSAANDGAQATSSKWIPNIASPSFDLGATATSLPFLQNLNPAYNPSAPPFVPSHEADVWDRAGGFGSHTPERTAVPAAPPPPPPLQQQQQQQGGAAPHNPQSAFAAVKDLLPLLQFQSRGPDPAAFNSPLSEGGEVTQDKLANVLSLVVSLLTQRMANRHVTVTGSPLLDDPAAIGTLLFLPRGSSEAVALQPVYDGGLLSVLAALGAQQRGGTPVTPSTAQNSFCPPPVNGANSSHVPNNGGGNAADSYAKQLLYQLQCLATERNGNFFA